MMTIRKLLHPTDFSEGADAAFDHALHMARHFEAELHVLHVVPTLGEDPIRNAFDAAVEDNAFARELWKDADLQMQALIDAYQHAHVTLRRVLARGTAAGPVILDYAESERVDAIVMGTHGRRGLGHLLLGSVAKEVVHRANCHVLTVRQQEGAGDEPRPIQRLLVPVDFSALSASLLRAGKELAASFGAHLDVLHVIQPLPFVVTMTTTLSVHELIPGLSEQTRSRLEDLFVEAGGPEVQTAFHVVEGHPARTIVQEAEEKEADLIVIAPHGLTRVERFFLGSVAEHVVRTATCPVFVAKTDVLEEEQGQAAAVSVSVA